MILIFNVSGLGTVLPAKSLNTKAANILAAFKETRDKFDFQCNPRRDFSARNKWSIASDRQNRLVSSITISITADSARDRDWVRHCERLFVFSFNGPQIPTNIWQIQLIHAEFQTARNTISQSQICSISKLYAKSHVLVRGEKTTCSKTWLSAWQSSKPRY